MPTLDDTLLPLFSRQHWLVNLSDVRAAGGTRAMIARRLRNGRWLPVDRDVYRLAGVPESWHARLLAPILSAGPPAMASHHAAAALHDIPGFGRGQPELSIPRGTEHRRDDVRVHTSTDLDRCSRMVVDGVPVTDVARTLLDLARTVSDARLLRAIEACRRTGSTDWPRLISTLARHARRGRPGIRRLRRVILANADRAEITDSDFELLALALVAESGLPTPVLHHRVHDGERFVAEVDLAYPRWRIAIERDGLHHLEEDVWQRDLPRQNELVLLGWTVLRFSWRRFRDEPEQVLAEIRAAIAVARVASA